MLSDTEDTNRGNEALPDWLETIASEDNRVKIQVTHIGGRLFWGN